MDNLLDGWPEDFCIASLHNYLETRELGDTKWRKMLDVHWVLLTSCVRSCGQVDSSRPEFSISEVMNADMAISYCVYTNSKYPLQLREHHIAMYIRRARYVRNLRQSKATSP